MRRTKAEVGIQGDESGVANGMGRAMRAKLSNYCLTWEQLYLAENPWVG